MNKLGNIEILEPGCNPTTIADGRGGIFTWVPPEPILEFNMLYFRPNKVRGNHFHPEFTEYFLVVSGSGVLVTDDPESGEELIMHASTGTCVRTPMGTSHAFHAITEVVAISLLTKPWDACEKPIVHKDLIPFDSQYQDYAKKHGLNPALGKEKND